MHRRCTLLILGLLTIATSPDGAAEYEYRAISEYIVRHEYAKAERALRLLVEQGETEAMYRLAGLYRGGQGFERRLEESALWYLRAAERGHLASMFLVAQCYERGIGVPSDPAVARTWYEEAARRGDTRAAARLDTLGRSEPDLFDAIERAGDSPALVERLRSADLSILDAQGRTLLMTAASAGAEEIVAALLERGLHPEAAVDRTRRTALFHGIASGDSAIVERLLAGGADPNRLDALGNAPLHLAAAAGALPIVEALLAAGARAETGNAGAWTAFDIATSKGHTAVAARLEASVSHRESHAGAGLDRSLSTLRDSERFKGFSDLDLAAWHGDAVLVAALLARGARDERGEDGHTALYWAVDRGQEDVVDVLLEAGTDPNVENTNAGSLLHLAVDRASLPMVDRLLAARADELVHNGRGETPLLYAITKRERALAERLARSGTAVARSDRSGRTPLLAAAAAGDRSLVLQLIDHGAGIAAFDNRERSVLWHAAGAEDGELVGELLARGATFEADDEGVTPLHRAIALRRVDAVRRLLAGHHPVDGLTASRSSPLTLAASLGDTVVVEDLIAAGADLNQRDAAGDTPLHKAATAGHLGAARALLDAGAKPGVRNDKDQNFFDIAAARDDADWTSLRDGHRSQLAKLLER